MLNVLTFTSLYPSDSQPRNGIFLENRLLHLRDSGRVNLRVVAPVPWFPFRAERFGKYAAFANTPKSGNRSGIEVVYPRYPVIPMIGMTVAPILMATGVLRTVQKIFDVGHSFDLIDSYYVYPDGVAAAMIAARLKVPFVMTALGSDINVLPKYYFARKWIEWAAGRAAHITTVSAALTEELKRLGIPETKVTTIRHGVDGAVFRPVKDRQLLRRKLGMTKTTLLSVGNLVEAKGHGLCVDAVSRLDDVALYIIGQGKEESPLRQQIASLQLDERVKLIGHLHQKELAEYYAAADVVLLASSREGIPNVLLESMSCGTPVIATNVGGVAEIVTSRNAGLLIEDRSAEAVRCAVNELLRNPPSRDETVAVARNFDWESTTTEHLEVFADVMSTLR